MHYLPQKTAEALAEGDHLWWKAFNLEIIAKKKTKQQNNKGKNNKNPTTKQKNYHHLRSVMNSQSSCVLLDVWTNTLHFGNLNILNLLFHPKRHKLSLLWMGNDAPLLVILLCIISPHPTLRSELLEVIRPKCSWTYGCSSLLTQFFFSLFLFSTVMLEFSLLQTSRTTNHPGDTNQRREKPEGLRRAAVLCFLYMSVYTPYHSSGDTPRVLDNKNTGLCF